MFEYLDAYHLYGMFFSLNLRHRNLCIHSNFPIKVNTSSLYKSTFSYYSIPFIIPNKHHINSIHLSALGIILPNISVDARWAQNGVTVAGGGGSGRAFDQLNLPKGLFIDDNRTIIIADTDNHRIIQWKMGDTKGQVVAGNRGDKNGTIVAGGNGPGADVNQFKWPTYIFVDQEQSVYVSDSDNHRVMKWNKGATEGIVVAGSQGHGNALTQLWNPNGLFVDTLGTLYVADSGNNRVMRWPEGAKQGTVIVSGNGWGRGTNQFANPIDMSFDRQGNLYVVDRGNDRVQRFSIE
ncbi:unnamed protein product [Rotaria sp. Silwood1]|nr:unnamed protein product [Rotaria sp. Silwood1]